MNKKISLGAAIAFALIVAAAVFSVTMVYSRQMTNQALVALQERETEYAKFSQVDREVRQRYYGEINEIELQDGISAGFLKGIGDPYAEYYSAEDYATILKSGVQSQASIGIVAKPSADGYLEVTEVYPDSPADTAGIKVGSIIFEIDGSTVNSSNSEQKILSFSGVESSQITLQVRHNGEESLHELVRRIVIPPTVFWEMIENTTTAYMRITDFQPETANQFSRALKEIQEQNGDAIIFDLRSNEGYELANAYRILDRLLPMGPIANAKFKDGTYQELETSDSNELTWPMAVIVNSETAGTAEIFTQVLRDYGKAGAVGTTTAGKGVRLETVPMPDGSAIKLTVAMYETPNGVVLDGEGLIPDFDITISGVEEGQWQNISKKEDTQLAKAIEVVSSK